MSNLSFSPINPVIDTQSNTEELPTILISNDHSSVTKAQNIYEKISEEKKEGLEPQKLRRNLSIERKINRDNEINKNLLLDRPDSPSRLRSSSAPFTLKITS